MKQVFLNLFKNALDAMRDGGRLTVQVAHEPGAEKITIANTGDPIRPEDLPKLFEPFFTTKPGGTGLGLLGQPAHHPGPWRRHPRRQQPRTRHGIHHHPAAQGPGRSAAAAPGWH